MKIIEISLSKSKILLLLIGSIIGIIASFWVTFQIADKQLKFNPYFVKLVGIIGMFFCILCLFFYLKKMFDKKIGLTINENGIIDNSSGVSVGLIEWKDIVEIKIEQVMSTEFILIYVKNSDMYINKANGFKAFLMKSNMKMYGTPLSISSNALEYDFNDLKKIIISEFDNYVNKK